MYEIIYISPTFTNIALLLARVILGIVMIYYGYPKISNLKSNADDFIRMGFKPGWLWGTFVAFLEFFGGIVLVLGIFTQVVALLFGFEMILGTIWKITKTKKPFTDWSYDLLLLAGMLLLLVAGPGTYVLISQV